MNEGNQFFSISLRRSLSHLHADMYPNVKIPVKIKSMSEEIISLCRRYCFTKKIIEVMTAVISKNRLNTLIYETVLGDIAPAKLRKISDITSPTDR